MARDGVMPPGEWPKPKAKKRKRRKAQTLTDQCDAVFSRLVRLPGVCARCGSTQSLQCAHGFSRRYRAVRWDLRNAWCLCKGCHLFFTMRPLDWDEWMRESLGPHYGRLREAALRGDRPDMNELLARLRVLESSAA